MNKIKVEDLKSKAHEKRLLEELRKFEDDLAKISEVKEIPIIKATKVGDLREVRCS